ncbi:MAG: acyltransferase domain-containing protein, partial [Pseudomonadota bacterium]|nr:acyltransferase domain-containing protein [Pseudomonadota bacterium]
PLPLAGEESIAALIDKGCRCFLEIGPAPVFAPALSARFPDAIWLASLAADRDDWQVLLGSLAALYVAGAAIDWEGFDKDYPRRRITLPTYPFQRQRYWLDRPIASLEKAGHPVPPFEKGGLGGISEFPNPPPPPFAKGGSLNPPPPPFTKGGSATLARLMARQLDAASQAAAQVVAQQLEFLRAGRKSAPPPRREAPSAARGRRGVVFLFPGVGDHYVGMGRGLYQSSPVFREQIDRCCDWLLPHLGADLREILYPQAEEAEAQAAADAAPRFDLRRMFAARQEPDPAARRLNRTLYSQPAVFVVEHALARLWISLGVTPQAMLGYSVGEYVAACLAGVLSLEDALGLLARRAQLMDALPAGAMLAVPLAEAELRPWLGDDLSLAAVSTPAQCVAAGPEAAIAGLEQRLREKGVLHRRLQAGHAFHSRMMEPLREPLTRHAQTLATRPPRIPYLSNVTGDWIGDAQTADPGYWAQHACAPVRFAEGVAALLATPARIVLEVGPGQSLGSFVLQHPALREGAEPLVLASLRSRYERQADEAFLLNALSRLGQAITPLQESEA